MSRNMAYRDDSRVDSALDLSLTRRYMADHDLESSQTVSASSAMPYAEPWSQFNPREPDLHSPYTPYDWPPETHIFDDLNADINAPCDSAFERSLSRIASGLQCASPEAASLTGYSPPPSPPLPQPWAVASSATASSPLPTSRYTDSNTACCGQCSQQFRGSYRRGNLARHVRHKHQGAKGGPYTCTADGCFRVYQRQDARLKHMRKKHPDLPLPTYQSRRGLEHCSTGLSDSERTFGQQHSSVEPESIGHCETTSPQRLTPAHHVFATLQQKLDYVTFSETCDNFFMRWERIVHELRITQSSAYPAYAKVLDDITAAVRDIDTRTHGCISDAQGGSKSCAPHGQRAGPRGNGRLAGGRTTKVQSDRISKSTSRKQHTGKSGNDGLLTLYDELLLPDNIEVDCPVFKYHSMNSFNPPCNGCRVSSMSQVRSHLNPDRNGRHGGYPAFVRQCSRCLEDFIDKRSYDDHKNSNSCTSETRVQGHIIIFWARQYLKLYPQVTRVPLPWPGHWGWLPESIVAQCRLPRGGPIPSSSFLGELHGGLDRPQSTVRSPSYEPSPVTGQDVAMDFVLQDLMTPRHLQSPPSLVEGQVNFGHVHDLGLGPNLIPLRPDDSRHYRNLVDGWGNLQGDLRSAEPNLSDDQVRDMAYQAQETYLAMVGMVESRRTHQMQNPPQAADSSPGPIHLHNDASYHTPLPPPPSQGSGSGHYNASGISTELSSFANGNGSSRHHDSTYTNPSSTLQADTQTLLSPFTFPFPRRTSLPHGDLQDESPLRRAFPSRLSLPDGDGSVPSPYLEPSVPETPDEDDFLARRLW